MKVWVQSDFQLFAEALVLLLEKLGLEPTLQMESHCEVALWDLTSTPPPFPPPPSLPTLALVTGGEADVVSLLKQHYRGYLRTTDDRSVLKRALEAVRRGEIWADRKMLTHALDSFRTPALTGREQATLHLLTKGFSNRNIAAQLGITEGTVKMHVSHLFDKLAVRSRAELIAQFLDHT
jgi:DNA-binding NarL/FixJ family response regulator